MQASFQTLIKKNYSHKIIQQLIDGEIKDGILDGTDFLALDNGVYQERIYFNLGPKDVILGYSNKSNSVLRFENRVLNSQNTENRSDAVFVANESGTKRVVSIFENKIAKSVDPGLIDKQINDVLRQVVERYLIPYYDNQQLLVSGENKNLRKKDKKAIVHLSLMFYWPEVYLQGKDQLIYYLNNQNKSDASIMLKETGFFCYNLSLSANDVVLIIDDYKENNKKEVLTILKDYYKRIKKTDVFLRKECNNFPAISIIKGNHKKNPWSEANNYSFDAILSELYNIPLWNMTTDSKINNTRDLNKENLTKQFAQISDTFCNNYIQKKKGVPLSEIYMGTGAKAREVSYDFYKTVVISLENKDYSETDWRQNMENEVMFISCDMSSIDGQHSTTTILDILNMLANKPELMSEEGVGFKEAERLFNKSMKKNNIDKEEKFQIEEFLKSDQLIEINFKGFENPDLAKRNAKNQNNISEQSPFDKFFDTYKALFKQLANFFNETQKNNEIKTYVPITKDAFSLPNFKEVKSNYIKLDISYFISLGALLSFEIKPFKNSYFSTNTSSANTQANWKKSQSIFFEQSEFLNILSNLLAIKIRQKEDGLSNIEFIDDIISAINNGVKNNNISNDQKKTLTGWNQTINMFKSLISSIDDEAVIEEQLENQYILIEKEVKENSILKKERILFIGNFIYAYLTLCPKENLKKIFSTDSKSNFYSLVYLMSLLREKYNDIDTLSKNYPNISSFNDFFNKIDSYISTEIIETYGKTNGSGEKVIKESIGIGGGEKDFDHEVLQKLYEFNNF